MTTSHLSQDKLHYWVKNRGMIEKSNQEPEEPAAFKTPKPGVQLSSMTLGLWPNMKRQQQCKLIMVPLGPPLPSKER